MDRRPERADLAPMVRPFFLIVALVVLGGATLVVAPGLIGGRWPWTLAPFNARFLGAVYLAELVAVAPLLAVNRWAPGRVVMPMSVVFTGLVTLVSVVYLGRFDPQRRATWLWFGLYVGSLLITAWLTWSHRHRPPEGATALGSGWSALLRGQAALEGAYGVALLVAPAVATQFWPWPVDDFHGRIYSAIFVTGSVGLAMLARVAARAELATVGLSHVVLGVAAIVGTIVVDQTARRVNWQSAGVRLWVGLMVELAAMGIVLLWRASGRKGERD